MYVHGAFPMMEEDDVFKLTVIYEKEGMIAEQIEYPEKIKHADKILELIFENPKVTAMEIGSKISLSESHVRAILAQLVSEKVIIRTGSRKNGELSLLK